MTQSGNETRAGRRLAIAWAGGLLGAWTLAWVAAPWVSDAETALRRAYWESLKLLVWVAPMAWVVHRIGAPRDVVGELVVERRSVALCLLWMGAIVGLDLALGRHHRTAALDATTLRIVLYAPLVEELAFRGVAQGALRASGLSLREAAVWTGVIFGAVHVLGWTFMGRGALQIAQEGAVVTVFGVVLGFVRGERTSLALPWLLHAANNAWSTGLVSLFSSGPTP